MSYRVTPQPIRPKGEKPKKARNGVRKVSKKRAAHRASQKGKDGLAHMGCVKQLPCDVCGAPPPSDAHHCKSKVPAGEHDPYEIDPLVGRGDMDVIPLCKQCHQDGPYAFHRGQKSWEKRNGPDYMRLPRIRSTVAAMIGG